jgi:hypothetical protein
MELETILNTDDCFMSEKERFVLAWSHEHGCPVIQFNDCQDKTILAVEVRDEFIPQLDRDYYDEREKGDFEQFIKDAPEMMRRARKIVKHFRKLREFYPANA